MNFTYENQGTNTYLVYTVSPEESIDSMSLGMLTNNKIPGLATMLFTQMDTTKYFKYNVSAHVPVSQFFAGAVNKKRLLGVFKGIVAAILSAEDYMIDESSILLDMDYIFADVSTCETVLVCLPVEQEAKRHDLGAFFKGIVFSTQFDQTENCDYVAKIINYLNSSPIFSLNDFSELLDNIEKGATAAPVAATPAAPVAQPVQQKVAQPVAQPVQQPVVQATPVQQVPQQKPVAPVQRPANIPNGNPAPVAAPVPTAAPVNGPAIPAQPAAPKAAADNDKGFSLFGMFSGKDKKAPKQPAPQPVKKPVQPVTMPGFEVPGAPAQQPAFEVPGQGKAIPVPGPKAVPMPQPGPKVAPMPQPAPKVAPMPQPAPKAVPVPQPVAPVPQPAPAPVVQMVPEKPLNFGETTVLGGRGGAIGETTVLGGAAAATVQNNPHLIRVKNNENIPLNKPVFRIGKERSYVDYFIGDNTAISRSHANIVNHNGEFYVVDTNSTNHTYVNGGMIQSNVETKLSHGTKIRFANEEFEFKMY